MVGTSISTSCLTVTLVFKHTQMQNLKSEFFKLDSIDRSVLLWTVTNEPGSIQSWIEYVSVDYRKRNSIEINIDKLYKEVTEKDISK